jgi:glucose-6-phosphate 1-dehydrogenase
MEKTLAKPMKNVTFIILGGTGDLTKRKLIPAIYGLIKDKKIEKFSVILCARTKISAKKVLGQSKKFVQKVKPSIWKKLEKNSVFQTLDFYQEEDYQQLKTKITSLEKERDWDEGKETRIFYLATLPQHFDTISHKLAKNDLAPGTSRVVYEKPFGSDLSSARKLNKCINRVFSEKQIYRIDHYLGKELVANISLMRFTNRILEPLWCGRHVKSVHIVLSEKIGVEGRGNYYDKYGVLKDVIQNHALQLLALTAMEPPRLLTGEYIRDKKADVLKNTRIKKSVLGQYKGYRLEEGVAKSSTTETFAKLELTVHTKRWKGVPFFITAGKALSRKETTIIIRFKEATCLLAKNCPIDTNYFKIRIQPESGFELGLHSKTPGSNILAPVAMNFCESQRFGPNTPNAYQTLLLDVIKGDQSVFVRNDEIEHAWRVVDKVPRRKLKYYRRGWGVTK